MSMPPSVAIKQESEEESRVSEEGEEEKCLAPPYRNDSSLSSAQQLPELTTVNGIGMWNQWTRNFRTPLLALLDLIDNAFDAFVESDDNFTGNLCVYTDTHTDTDATCTQHNQVSGLVLKNNSPRHIKPMAQILQVYQSAKGNLSESICIGENGVGLKQGCATLSDLSFCLSKNLCHYSLGILSRSLQREDGCSLPSFTFVNFPTFRDLQDLFHEEHNALVGDCVKQYGNGSLTRGINRLLIHIQQMNDRHVFMVILHNLRHGSYAHSDNNDNSVDYAQSALGLLQKLAQELPRHYIHVPSNVDVRLQDERIANCYWQNRLIELSHFNVKIDPNHAVANALDWKLPSEGYSLRILAGFDPRRVNESSKSPVSLYVYSRQSGRLIKHSVDARSVLGLTSSGTHYCQGLTILVDDINGKLPLNPTKQDLAFGEEANGEIHRSNLYTWLSAVTKLYYNFHLSKFENSQKGLLTEQVKRHVHAFQHVHFVKPLSECRLTTFVNVHWVRQQSGLIYARKNRHVHGKDTLVQLEAPKRKKPASGKNGPSQQPKTAASRTTTTQARCSASSLPVIEISSRPQKRKADSISHDEQPETTSPLSVVLPLVRNGTLKLQRENSRLREDKIILKDALRTALDQRKELEKQNASLKKALLREQSRNSSETQELKNALEQALKTNQQQQNQDRLSLAKREVEELTQALAASQENVQVARNETEIQQEIANDLRQKCAQLKRCVELTNSNS